MTLAIPHNSSFAVIDSLRDCLGVSSTGTCGLARFELQPHLGSGCVYVQQWGADNYHFYCAATLREELTVELPGTGDPHPQSVAVVSGSLALDIGESKFVESLDTHMSCVFRPGVGHAVRITIPAGDQAEVSFIHFGQSMVDELRTYLCDSPIGFLFANAEERDETLVSCGSRPNYAVSELLTHTFGTELSGLAHNAYTHGKTLLVVGEQLKLAEASATMQVSDASFTNTEIRELLQTKAIIDEEYASDLTIAKLARTVGVNQQKLKSGFKKFFNVTISRYIRSVRIKTAQRMFDTGRWTVGEVANMVGYTNQSHFAARFREEVGLSPSRYLRQPRQRSIGMRVLEES